jgi:multiple sugar transport system substrate-binding protein
VAGGAPPDLFLMNYRFYGQFAAKDVIEPLDDRLAASEAVDPADYYPVAWNAFRWKDRQLCLPQNVSSLAVYYNRTLFAKYGVPEPKAGWTWNDLVATASAMTRDSRGAVIKATESEGAALRPAVHGLGVEPSIIRLAPFVWSNGGQLVDDPTKPTRLTLDTPAAREALKNLVDLRLAYGVVPTDEEVEAEDDESRFANGRLAMLMSSRRSTTTFRSITGFEWDVAPLPVYREQVGVLHSDAYCMTRGAKNKDAAWRFLEFAIAEEGQRIIAATGRTVPSHVAVSQSPAFLGPAQPPRSAKVFLDAIPTVRALPTVSTWPEIEDVTYGILENAMHRGDRLDDVIRDLDRQTRPLFARGEHG